MNFIDYYFIILSILYMLANLATIYFNVCKKKKEPTDSSGSGGPAEGGGGAEGGGAAEGGGDYRSVPWWVLLLLLALLFCAFSVYIFYKNKEWRKKFEDWRKKIEDIYKNELDRIAARARNELKKPNNDNERTKEKFINTVKGAETRALQKFGLVLDTTTFKFKNSDLLPESEQQ